jgi:nicotinamidase-related amidase
MRNLRWPASIVAVTMTIALFGSSVAAQQLPAAPSPVAVALSGPTTAVLVLDVITPICGSQPRCQAFVPRIVSLLATARRAGSLVVYSAASPNGVVAPIAQPPFLAEIAPVAGDPIVMGVGQDRFFDTRLDETLRAKGVTTVVLVGWRENGSLLYTAIGANLRGYTVVVADDATSATEDYDVAVGRYQLLTQLNGNPKNEPLHKGAVTLSRTDLITFR